MRSSKVAFTLILFLLASRGSFAEDIDVTVCKLQVNDNGNAYMSPCEGWTTKNNCPSTAPWITWSLDSVAGKVMYSTALVGLTTGMKVTVRVDGSTCNGYDVTSIIKVSK
ncbi:hypothetical protein [Teredinibacter sp. KSP-S5-2]|uniref:hypothetical protein n=1 Tax=Teredinibacter sp. KSP-S5-2 TaxID=3034506 RepID=UPI002934C337|nr:hypothetical protein [Teredinibacter sp. KSP-S5-2]WNO07829.1 hypothetical protein P5V12_12600 [Teredinibacter sp. KSP-S5-2]